jgi:hypothetical protein
MGKRTFTITVNEPDCVPDSVRENFFLRKEVSTEDLNTLLDLTIYRVLILMENDQYGDIYDHVDLLRQIEETMRFRTRHLVLRAFNNGTNE